MTVRNIETVAKIEALAHKEGTIKIADETDAIIEEIGNTDGTTYELVACVMLARDRLKQRGLI